MRPGTYQGGRIVRPGTSHVEKADRPLTFIDDAIHRVDIADRSGHLGILGDEMRRFVNVLAGWHLCWRCDGTGNELKSMFRSCVHCEGKGHLS